MRIANELGAERMTETEESIRNQTKRLNGANDIAIIVNINFCLLFHFFVFFFIINKPFGMVLSFVCLAVVSVVTVCWGSFGSTVCIWVFDFVVFALALLNWVSSSFVFERIFRSTLRFNWIATESCHAWNIQHS